ncbi:MAG: hypothetical protein M5U25_17040 [Planctomycetota bacterium]|nr:hypothetical protein [Planctomycetota bacterium]
MTVSLNGGAATAGTGGSGGYASLEQDDYGHSIYRLFGTLDGGDGATGGNGGGVNLDTDDQYSTVELTLNAVTANGGDATAGVGGTGGYLDATPNGTSTGAGSAILRGSMTARGGKQRWRRQQRRNRRLRSLQLR